jgi:hypothetical protein
MDINHIYFKIPGVRSSALIFLSQGCQAIVMLKQKLLIIFICKKKMLGISLSQGWWYQIDRSDPCGKLPIYMSLLSNY